MLPEPTYTLPHCPCQGGQGGKEGDLHEEPLAKDKRVPETNLSCGHKAEPETPPPWPGPCSCSPSSPSAQVLPHRPCLQAQAPGDPKLDLPQTLSSVQHSPKAEPAGLGSLSSTPSPLLLYRLCGLLRTDPVVSLVSGLGRDGQDHLHRGFTG